MPERNVNEKQPVRTNPHTPLLGKHRGGILLKSSDAFGRDKTVFTSLLFSFFGSSTPP